ncbi:MAG: PKD domain-containing protein [Dysgonamonadaceae bacterium]|nr:PKD domain-containing protein [Dysgonamonadaceae bacterium]
MQDGICRSALSAAKNIATTSGAAGVTISPSKTTNIHAGNTVTYTAAMDNPQGATYQWTVASGTTNATPTSGTGDKIAVNFSAAGTATVSLAASNACGTATVTVFDFAAIPVGTGTLTGRSCFDVAQINDGGTCGDLASRQALCNKSERSETKPDLLTEFSARVERVVKPVRF